MLAPGEVLDQAHDEAVLLRGLDHDRGDLRLAESDERLESALAAHEVVARLVRPLRHRDRLLQAEMRDARDQFVEDPLVPRRAD